jgi:hypothetical protein
MSPLMNFILNNQENLRKNSSVCSINTGNKNYFQRTEAKFACFLEKVILMLALNIEGFTT